MSENQGPSGEARTTPAWLTGRWAFLVIGSVVGLVVGVGLGEVAGDDSPTSEMGTDASPVLDEATPTEEETPEEVTPEPVALPEPEDIRIDIKILEKTCFGSAGCNITFRIDPSYVGAVSVPEDVTIEVIYEVLGGEDGPQINTFTVTGGTAEFEPEEFLSTSSSSAKITARATEVIES